ncbi:MAG TPA: hypothetical protein VL981_11155 [Candidatus Methylacidiphilales bacterium]|nr:hypothetical protein [Candidatus Methylacidiphilales bacterium]
MIHITIPLPDDVAQQYYNASEKLAEHFGDPAPNAQTLMRFMLAGFTADDVARHFDRALRNLTGAPMPDETDTYVFSSEFDQVPETEAN